jgi:NAD(P)H dehydrogenase (quinone)
MLRVPETLPADILAKMNAAPKPDYPIITPDKLAEYDAFLLGIPAAFGSIPTQWKVSCASRSTHASVQRADVCA